MRLRTTNVVPSAFVALRLRTDAAKRFERCGRATGVIRKMLMVAKPRLPRLDAPLHGSCRATAGNSGERCSIPSAVPMFVFASASAWWTGPKVSPDSRVTS